MRSKKRLSRDRRATVDLEHASLGGREPVIQYGNVEPLRLALDHLHQSRKDAWWAPSKTSRDDLMQCLCLIEVNMLGCKWERRLSIAESVELRRIRRRGVGEF